jgi:hypothetical protein
MKQRFTSFVSVQQGSTTHQNLASAIPDDSVKIIIPPLMLVRARLIRVSAIFGWLPPHFLASSFACQSLFDTPLLAGLEVKGVFLSFFYDVFL